MSLDRKEPMAPEVEISAIIPVGKRYDDIRGLYYEYKSGLESSSREYEIIYVLDGDLPGVLEELKLLQNEGEQITVIKLAKFFGEATALTAGFENSSGHVILTLPAYYQVEASEIPKVLNGLQNYDMVISRRWPRMGSGFERLRRNMFHLMLKFLTGSSFRDLGCGVRAFKRQVIVEVPIYGDQHRFLPVLASRRGFRIKELGVRQSAKDSFHGVYRLREYLHRVLDIFTIFFLTRFTKKPLRFFGIIGTATFALGGLMILYLIIERLFFDIPLADRPALLLSSLLVVLGVQIFGLGLIGELIIFTHARDLKEYTIDEIIN